MKVLYPELVFGAIASSGEYCVRVTTQANAQFGHPLNLNILAVTHAALENWEYMEIIRQAADPKCAAHLENTVRTIDSILLRGDDAVSKALKRHLKGLFGVADLEHDEDFVSLVEVSLESQSAECAMLIFLSRTQSPLSTWQAKNWDPAVGSTKFEEFCEALDKSIFGHSELLPEADDVADYDTQTRMVSFSDGLTLDISILNYAKYVREVSTRGL